MRRRHAGWIVGVLAVGTVLLSGAAAGLIPGGGPQRSDCFLELDVQGVETPTAQVRSNRIIECADGDACDTGPCGDDVCTLRIAVCIGQSDPDLPACTPPASLRRIGVNARLQAAIPATLRGSACGSFVDVPVGVRVKRNGAKRPGMLALPANAVAERGTTPARDRDKFVLRCLPRTDTCPGVTPTTTTTLPGASVTTVTAGDGGSLRFSPQTVRIRVGETVRWRFSSAGHNVVSGSGGNANGRFCSPDDTGCGSAPLARSGDVYSHTFAEPGTFAYFCAPHQAFGMTGQVIVEP